MIPNLPKRRPKRRTCIIPVSKGHVDPVRIIRQMILDAEEDEEFDLVARLQAILADPTQHDDFLTGKG